MIKRINRLLEFADNCLCGRCTFHQSIASPLCLKCIQGFTIIHSQSNFLKKLTGKSSLQQRKKTWSNRGLEEMNTRDNRYFTEILGLPLCHICFYFHLPKRKITLGQLRAVSLPCQHRGRSHISVGGICRCSVLQGKLWLDGLRDMFGVMKQQILLNFCTRTSSH